MRSGSILVLLLVPVLLGVGILGLLLVVRGLRGRRVGDHPVCRKCGYTLLGVPEPRRACPECGADLTARKAVPIGDRRRRPGLVAVGAALLVLGLGGSGSLVWQRARNIDWNPVKPLWWLRAETSSRNGRTVDAALGEMLKRIGAGRLSDDEILALAERGLAVQTSTAPWHPRWGSIVESAWTREILADDALAQYLRQGVEPGIVLSFRRTVRAGAAVPAAVNMGPFRVAARPPPAGAGPAAPARTLWYRVTTVRSEDGTERGSGAAMGTPYYGGLRTSARVTDRMSLEPGVHELTYTLEFRIVEGSEASFGVFELPVEEALAAWTSEHSGPVTVVAASTTVVETFEDPELAAPLRAALSVEGISRSSSEGQPLPAVSIIQSPADIAFEVWGRAGDREERLGSLVAAAGENVYLTLGSPPQARFPSVPVIDFVFRARPELAEQHVAITRVWQGEVVVENVRIVPFDFANATPEALERELRKIMRPTVRARGVFFFTGRDVDEPLPLGIAADLVCRIGDREHVLGTLVRGQGTRGMIGGYRLPRGWPGAATALDLILRPRAELRAEAAGAGADGEWLEAEVRFRRVPIEP